MAAGTVYGLWGSLHCTVLRWYQYHDRKRVAEPTWGGQHFAPGVVCAVICLTNCTVLVDRDG